MEMFLAWTFRIFLWGARLSGNTCKELWLSGNSCLVKSFKFLKMLVKCYEFLERLFFCKHLHIFDYSNEQPFQYHIIFIFSDQNSNRTISCVKSIFILVFVLLSPEIHRKVACKIVPASSRQSSFNGKPPAFNHVCVNSSMRIHIPSVVSLWLMERQVYPNSPWWLL